MLHFPRLKGLLLTSHDVTNDIQWLQLLTKNTEARLHKISTLTAREACHILSFYAVACLSKFVFTVNL